MPDGINTGIGASVTRVQDYSFLTGQGTYTDDINRPGQALLEEAISDPEGQLLTGSYMDYCIPRADNLPSIQIAHETTLCTHNSLGVKVCGEVSAIGSPPAVINAVLDALTDFGVEDIALPATAARVWQAMQDAKA